MNGAAKKFVLTVLATVLAAAIVADWKWRFAVTDRLARIETKLQALPGLHLSLTEQNKKDKDL